MNSKSHFNNNRTQRRNIHLQQNNQREEPVPVLQSRLNERQLEIARRGKLHSKERSDFQSLRSSQHYTAPKNQLSPKEIQELLRKKATSSLIRNPSKINEKALRQLQNSKSGEYLKEFQTGK